MAEQKIDILATTAASATAGVPTTGQSLPTTLLFHPTAQLQSLVDEEVEDFIPGFYEAVKEFKHPSCIANFEKYDIRSPMEISQAKFGASLAATRLYLCGHLEGPREGKFDLMGLLAEIREKIYKMLLMYPKLGLTLAKCSLDDRLPEHNRLGVLTLDEDMESETVAYGIKKGPQR
ncbi:hypothetical protein BST61_g5428 [Cercospora zeina]